MSNLLKNNIYNILGLDTSASQKDLQKRAKEIVKFLQIDETPQYDLDLGIFDDFRTEASVKEALHKLTSPKKQIKEYFFWFNIADHIDHQSLGILGEKKTDDAIRIWSYNSATDSTKSLFYKKNLAILYCLLLFKEHNEQYLKESVKIWYELCNSNKFWNAFNKIYKLNDELNTDEEILSDFHQQCPSYLSDLYTELSHKHKNDSYISEFTNVFNIKGEKTEKDILAPIFNEITVIVEQLEAMNIIEGGKFDQETLSQIKQHITKIQEYCNKLIDLGLYDDSQSKAIRDRAAAAIHSIALDIHNNLDDIPKAEQLINIAMQFVGTDGMKHKLQQDIDTIEKDKKYITEIAPILELINDKKFHQAIALIDKMKEEYENDTNIRNALNSKKQEAVTLYGAFDFLEAKKLFDDGNYHDAIPLFQKSASTIYHHIEIFDVNKETLDSWIETIISNSKLLTADNADGIDAIQNDMIKKIDETYEERWEKHAIKVLVNDYYYIGISEFIKNKKTANVWRWIIGVVVIILLRIIFG